MIIDNDTDEIIRKIQAKLVIKTNKSWSYTKVAIMIMSIGIGSKDFDRMIDIIANNSLRGKK
jgi:hypothetical protein